MSERHTLCLVLCLPLLCVIVQGFQREWPKWNRTSCVSILASDLVFYQGKKCKIYVLIISILLHLSDIGTSTLRIKNAREVLKLRESVLLSSILDSISCLITIVETDYIEEVLMLIEMVNELYVAEKHLLLISPKFDSAAISTLFQNITIHYNVVLHHTNAGEMKTSVQLIFCFQNMSLSGRWSIQDNICLPSIGQNASTHIS